MLEPYNPAYAGSKLYPRLADKSALKALGRSPHRKNLSMVDHSKRPLKRKKTTHGFSFDFGHTPYQN